MSVELTKPTVEEGEAPSGPIMECCEAIQSIPPHIRRPTPFKCAYCGTRWTYTYDDFNSVFWEKVKSIRVEVVQEILPQDGSSTLPLGTYDITDVKWKAWRNMNAGDRRIGSATFVVVEKGRDTWRRIGVISMSLDDVFKSRTSPPGDE